MAALTSADAELIAASLADSDRFAVLYDRYAEQLYRYAYQRVGAATAEDVVANTFLAAFTRRASYDQSRPDARPWLFGILTKEIAGHRRTEQAHYRALLWSGSQSTVDGHDHAVAETVSAVASGRVVTEVVAGLPARDRDVLLLVAWGELSYEEVATALRIPPGTVASRLHRARRSVQKALGGINPMEES